MTEKTRLTLSEYLSCHYASLKHRLTRVLGNSDLAGDALQDAWIRLQAKDGEELVSSPLGYVLRVAVNIAVDIQRRQSRTLSWDEIEGLQEMADPAPGMAQAAEARSDMRALLAHIDTMPGRRRYIFLQVHWEGKSHKEVAQCLGVSLRTVAYELKKAHDALADALQADCATPQK